MLLSSRAKHKSEPYYRNKTDFENEIIEPPTPEYTACRTPMEIYVVVLVKRIRRSTPVSSGRS